ncbi:MAG: septum formation initiator family protein [Acidimicrobiales bacterium]|nr:septum formation initiator family protein [Acidimicrobiales bacterium]
MTRTRLVVAFLGSVAVIAVLAVAVFPTRLWMDQKRDIASAEHRVAVLNEANTALQKRIDELGTDSAVERLAREQLNLVKPGETAYAVLPPADDAKPRVTTPLAPVVEETDRNFWERLRDRLSFWA